MSAQKQERRSFKVIIIGDSAVGKTSIMERYVSQRFSALYKPTVGTDFLSKELTLDGTTIKLQIWDTAGQETWCNQMGAAYYRGSDSCIFVYDVTSIQSLQNIQKWYDSFTQHISTVHSPLFFLVGNKSDMVVQSVGAQQVQEMARQLSIPASNVYEVSAKTGLNIETLFLQVANQCLHQHKAVDVEDSENFVLQKAEEEPGHGRRGCC